MPLLFTPPESRFDDAIKQDALKLAETVIEHEKNLRLGESGDLISPMKYFIFKSSGEFVPLWGEMFGKPQEHPKLSEKDQIALLVKIIVHVLKSRFVLFVTEAWSSKKCHACGKDYDKDFFERDQTCFCGAKYIQPSGNPHRTEILTMQLVMFTPESDKGEHQNECYLWAYDIHRDSSRKITGYSVIQEKEFTKVSGRMCDHWALHDYELPHFAINMPHFCRALGCECPEEYNELSKIVTEACPPNYKILKWGVTNDLEKVIKVVEHDQICENAENN